MQFVHPGLLYALLLGSIPIIIYYLMRFRSLKVRWGANYVLERALARLKKKLYLDQLILLALRVLALLLLVFAFARPLLRSDSTEVSGTGVHRVILVDGSYSMLAEEAGKTAWQNGLGIVKDLVSTWGRGEQWSLCLAGRNLEWIVSEASVTTAEECHAVLDRLKPQETSISIAGAIEQILARTAGRPTEIYIVADDQAKSWRNMDQVENNDTEEQRFFWINVSLKDRRNLAVTRVQVSQQRLLAGHPCRTFVRVKNFSDTAVDDVEISVLVDGRHAAKERRSLLPGQEVWVHADIVLQEAGSHYVTARLGDDVLPFDNDFSAGMDVRETLSVFVLKDKEKNAKFDSAHGFVDLMAGVAERASPNASTDRRRGSFTVAEPAAAGAALPLLQESAIVIVDGGTSLTPDLVDTLSAFVRGGGCLLLAPDDSVDAGSWEALLGPAELLPARLGRRHVEALGGEKCERIARAGFVGPELRSFATDQDGDIATVRFYSWFDILNPVAGATVLAQFSSGKPFAVQRRYGPGSVILLAAGLNCGNNSLIVRETSVALLTRLFMTGYSASGYNLTVAKGEPIRILIDGPDAPAGVQFTMPDDEARPLIVERVPYGLVATLPGGAGKSGLASVLVIREAGHDRVWFGVQGPRPDSDLAAIPEDEMTRIRERLDLVDAASWKELDAALASSRQGQELYTWAILLLLTVAAGEMLMQRKFI